MRNLATIQKVINITPIEGADRIESVRVLGWSVICKKGDFKIGDLVIYIECDSIVPDIPIFEFMKERKFRVRTVKMKSTISQGLCMRIDDFKIKSPRESMDVTDILNIKKYDPEGEKEARLLEQQNEIKFKRLNRFMKRYKWYRVLKLGKRKTSFPKFIKKTDEERIQRMPWVLNDEKETDFIITEKLDGTSLTVFLIKNPYKWMFWKPTLFGVCSRNIHLVRPDNSVYWRIAKKYDMENKLKSVFKGKDIIIQGEIVGAGVQDNKYGFNDIYLYVFNVIFDGKRINNSEMVSFCTNNELKTVPTLENTFKLPNSLDEFISFSNGQSSISKNLREGIVCRNYDKNISFKVISPDFLLKYNL